MCPAVPRIIGAAASPPLLLPEIERAQRPPVGEMLSEELAQQALVGARGGVVEGRALFADEEAAQRVARLGWQLAPDRREPTAARAERTAGAVAKDHGGTRVERSVTVA